MYLSTIQPSTYVHVHLSDALHSHENKSVSCNNSLSGLICLNLRRRYSLYCLTSIMFLQGLVPLQRWAIGCAKCGVRLLQFFTAVETLQDTMLARFSGALLWPTLCHCAHFSGPLCFIYNVSLILHFPDPPRVGPAFIGLSPLFSLNHRRLVGSAHKERVANHRPPLINLGQCPLASYLHSDETSQSGVSTGEDLDSTSQWLREVQSFGECI